MTILLEAPVPGFTDFLLLAVVLSLFHLAGILEILTFQKNLHNFYSLDIRGNTTVALMGVAITIGCGMAAGQLGANGSRLLISIPVLFTFGWAYFQLKKSRLLTFDSMENWMKSLIKADILSFARNHQPFTIDELRKNYRQIIRINSMYNRLLSYAPKYDHVSSRIFRQIVQPFLLKETNLSQLLQELVHENKLSRNGKQYTLRLGISRH